MKVCFAASSGGHYEEIKLLEPLMNKYDGFIVTEKTPITLKGGDKKIYYLRQVNRKEKGLFLKMILNSFTSLRIIIKENPDAVICTGVLATIPICLLMKMVGKKLIYIESFSKLTSATRTGKLLYRFADRFYVQWESMLKVYPRAIYNGGIY